MQDGEVLLQQPGQARALLFTAFCRMLTALDTVCLSASIASASKGA
jgi:hypothetical protein